MDITQFVLGGRDQALLYGDYSTYRVSLKSRLLSARKRLGRVTKKGAKYTNKSIVTAQDIRANNDSIHLVLLAAERAWAHAMSIKAAHSVDEKGITGPTRSHIISRLHKAAAHVDDLIVALSDPESGATEQQILEARAYATSLNGAENFEKQSWDACINTYSETWVLYTALNGSLKSEQVTSLLSDTVEQSIRYAAYQIGLPRTATVSAIARKRFPRTDKKLVASIDNLNPSILRDSAKTKNEDTDMDQIATTVTWRSRTVNIEDALIVTALGAVNAASEKLSVSLASIAINQHKERAAAYDELLIASQDAVDAVKDSISELVTEGVAQGDERMQSLQIARTSISYDTISWRIGRNRVMTGEQDGALLDSSPIAKSKKTKNAKDAKVEKGESTGRRAARLREKVVMYDSTLQSLDTIKELPGVANDPDFVNEIQAKQYYFRALKCLAIARSHSMLQEHRNALVLLVRASDMLAQVSAVLLRAEQPSTNSPPSISISSEQIESLSRLLTAETQRLRAMVDLSILEKKAQAAFSDDLPLVERLDIYPPKDVDLTNLVSYPPRMMPIPVKPLFFDVAWNYIQYPGKSSSASVIPNIPIPEVVKNVIPVLKEEPKASPEPPKKKGWFF